MCGVVWCPHAGSNIDAWRLRAGSYSYVILPLARSHDSDFDSDDDVILCSNTARTVCTYIDSLLSRRGRSSVPQSSAGQHISYIRNPIFF